MFMKDADEFKITLPIGLEVSFPLSTVPHGLIGKVPSYSTKFSECLYLLPCQYPVCLARRLLASTHWEFLHLRIQVCSEASLMNSFLDVITHLSSLCKGLYILSLIIMLLFV